MIYATPFNPETRKQTGVSTVTGLKTLDRVEELVGNGWLRRGSRAITYAGIIFSDYPFETDESKLDLLHNVKDTEPPFR